MSEIPLHRLVGARRARTPALSRDGRNLAWVSDDTGFFEAWLAQGAGRPPRMLTDFRERVGRLLFTSDGRRLILDTDLGGDERWAIRSVRPDGGDHRTLTDDPRAMHLLGGVSPDGRWISCATNARDRAVFDPALLDPSSGARRVLMESGESVFPTEFSPDGRWVVGTRFRGSFRQQLVLLPTRGGEPCELTPGDEAVRRMRPTFEPSGRSMLLLSDRDRDFLALGRLHLEDLGQEVLHGPEGRDVEDFAAAADGSAVLLVVNERGWSRVRVLVPATGEVRDVRHPDGVASEVVVSADGARGAFTLSGPGLPPEVFEVDVAAGEAAPAATPPRQELPGEAPEAEEVRFRSFDGTEIPGWLWVPRRHAGARPAVVKLHGGPEAQARPEFDPLTLHLLSRGVAVYEPNVRGSTGYGRAFAALDDRRLRFDAVKDLAEAARFLGGRSEVDAGRLTLLGGSYGGFLVLAGLAFFPDLWAAGVSICGIADFRAFLAETGTWRRSWRIEEYGDPERDGGFLDSISPVRRADRIRAPLLVVQGANDPRVPVALAKEVVSAVRSGGGVAEYLEFPDEGHGIVKRANRLRAWEAVADFVAAHGSGAGGPA